MNKIIGFLCAVLLILGMVLPASALPISINGTLYEQMGSSENVAALFTQADGGVSNGLYSGFVELIVSGTGQSQGSILNDAFYLFTGSQTPAHNAQHHQLVFDTQTLISNNPPRCIKHFIIYDVDAHTEVTAPYVPAYSSDHIYNFVIDLGIIAPKNLHFGVSDGKFNDNSGAYNIEISQLKPIPEPTSILLFGSGLIGIISIRKFRMKFKLYR